MQSRPTIAETAEASHTRQERAHDRRVQTPGFAMRTTCFAVLALAGCASAPPGRPTSAPAVFSATSLQKLASHTVTDVTGVIGAPVSQDPAVDGTVHTWKTTSRDSTWVPTPVMTVGFISGLPRGADSTGGGGQNLDRDIKCRVRITGGADDSIRHIDFNGSHAACDPVKSQITDWIDQVG